MAEIELGVLNRQCLNRRIPDKATLEHEVNAWQNDRNSKLVKVDWRFTTVDARIKLIHLYPEIHVCHSTSDFAFPKNSNRLPLLYR